MKLCEKHLEKLPCPLCIRGSTPDWRERALRAEAEVVALKAALQRLLAAGVDLEAAIHSEPDMSGRLKNLHISTVRGAEPLRKFAVALSEIAPVLATGGSDLLDAVRKAHKALAKVVRAYEEPDLDGYVPALIQGEDADNVRVALEALSRFLPEGT
jgi:hypothetical protein